jgi:type I restriction enzyme, S subunit
MLDRVEMAFGDLGDLFDGPHATPVRRETGPYFLNISSLQSGRLNLAESDHVSPEDFKKWTRRVTPRAGDLLFSYETRIGEAALMVPGIDACLGRRMALLRPNRAVVDPRFLLYYYLSPDFQRLIAANTIHGATVSRIGLATMPRWRVDVPGIKTQRAIAEVLGALDDKIAANDRVIEGVDRVLGAQFERLTMGTDSTPLGALARVNVAQVRPASGGSIRYVDISAVGVGSYDVPPAIPWDQAPGRARRVLKYGDTVWSTVRPNRRSHALVLDRREDLVASTGLAVLTPNPNRVAGLYEATKLPRFSAYLESVAEGSAYPAVRSDRFLEAPVPDLPAQVWDGFESIAMPMRLRCQAAVEETRTLAHVRDELLPLLMSGRVRVREAEEMAEEVL